jgi:hypothetical protein
MGSLVRSAESREIARAFTRQEPLLFLQAGTQTLPNPEKPSASATPEDEHFLQQRSSDSPDDPEAQMRRALGLDRDIQKPTSNRPVEPEGHVARQRTVEAVISDRRKRRFVQDGEVPVIVVQGRREHSGEQGGALSSRLERAEAAANAERTARLRAEKSLQEALAAVRDLRTKHAHAEMASTEAHEAARAHAVEAQSLREAVRDREQRLASAEAANAATDERLATLEAALSAERSARKAAEKALSKALEARSPVKKQPTAPPARTRANRNGKATADQATVAAKRSRAAQGAAVSSPAPRAREPQPVKWWLKSTAKPKKSRTTPGRVRRRR